MDKEWTKLPRFSREFINGVESFLDFAYTKGRPIGGEIFCPCAKCKNHCWTRRNVVYDHLIAKGFLKGYNVWVNHGEEIPTPGRKRCYERTATPSVLKRNEEIDALKKQHYNDMTSLRKRIERLEALVRFLLKQLIPNLDEEAVDNIMTHTLGDDNSAAPQSSISTQCSRYEKV